MKRILLCALLVSLWACGIFADPEHKDVKTMIFEEQKIEGKIRRPQLVLIQADQRPEFTPMVLQSLGKGGNITDQIDEKVLDNSPYDKPFQFKGTKITKLIP